MKKNIQNKLPNFLIVGTMKSGTSSLANLISNHSNVYIAPKELHFFDALGKYRKRWKLGLNWYSKQFSNAKNGQLLGEKTPTYSYLKDVPERISKTIPNAKIIWILRNPINRTYSNYWHAVINGTENKSFSNALRMENDRIKSNIWAGYKTRSLYSEQIKRYLNYFDINQMLFITFEDFKKNPQGTSEKVCDFLGLEFEPTMLDKNEITNKSKLPYIRKIRYWTIQIFGSTSIVSKIEKKINSKGSKYPPMSIEDSNYLKESFNQPNLELEKITGLNLDQWRN